MTELVEREVDFGNGESTNVSLNRPVARLSSNPILFAEHVNEVWTDPALQVKTVHNAGAAVIGSQTVLLFRSHLRCGMSVLGLARSDNGIDGWRVDPGPVMKPARAEDSFADGADRDAIIESEAGGVEDPRIMKIDDTYAITYSSYHASIRKRVRVSLATTKMFKTFTRCGAMLDQNMRNVVIFPRRLKCGYAALFRPNDATDGDVGGIFTQIKIGYAADWRSNEWSIEDKPVIRTGGGPSAFSDKIGPGAPPIETEAGWLNIFHGVRATMDGNPYVLGVALHDLDDPSRVKVCSIPILFPSWADCRVSEDSYIHTPNVVFTCGAIMRDDGSILIYYGGNDTVMNAGLTHKDVLLALCERYPRDSVSGKLLYGD